MIVSNLFKKRTRFSRYSLPISQFFIVQPSYQKFAARPKMTVSDSMENVSDIFSKLNQQISGASGEGLAPRIVSQKEDVVYIKNPSIDWRLNKVLNFTGDNVAAITIAL